MIKRMIYLNISAIAAILLCSCGQNGTEDSGLHSEVKTFFDNPKHVTELIDNAINKGNTDAFNEVHKFYYMDGRESELLNTSMVMANKYHYPTAYFDVYSELCGGGGHTFEGLDERTKNLALCYLALSKENGYKLADNEASRIGIKSLLSSSYYTAELTKLDSAKIK